MDAKCLCVITVFLTTLLSACVSNDYQPRYLLKYSDTEGSNNFKTFFNIKESFTVTSPKRTYEYTVRVEKGTFTSKYKTDDGILYEGSDACMTTLSLGGDFTATNNGGFFIPYDKDAPVRLWYDRSTRVVRDRNGIKVMDRYHLPMDRGYSKGIWGPDHIGISLSPPISPTNDREVRILSGNYANNGQ